MKHRIDNILDLIREDGEDRVAADLTSFSCAMNIDIQNFLQYKAIDFAKKRMSITYLVFDKESGEILGYFTLTHKVLYIPADGLSNTTRRRLERYGSLDKNTNSYLMSAFLLAQLGKNFALGEENRITGTDLMDCVDSILKDIQYRVGGGVVYLDSLDNRHLAHFYEDICSYRKFSERVSETNNTKYLQYLKFVC